MRSLVAKSLGKTTHKNHLGFDVPLIHLLDRYLWKKKKKGSFLTDTLDASFLLFHKNPTSYSGLLSLDKVISKSALESQIFSLNKFIILKAKPTSRGFRTIKNNNNNNTKNIIRKGQKISKKKRQYSDPLLRH